MFSERKLLIVTKHEKEKVIAPILEKALGLTCYVVQNFDTDSLGTFTGEIDRKKSPVETALDKCKTALEINEFDLAIASEGSFGAHPTAFFVSADEEIVALVDNKNDLQIVAKAISTDTNFNASEIISKKDLVDFANNAGFPSHALIIRKSKDDYSFEVKGINNWEKLFEVYEELSDVNGIVYIETDMRAMYNPSRMKVIEEAVLKLVDKIQSVCESCNTPGFEVVEVVKGLPCSWCTYPTNSILYSIYECKKCKYRKEEYYPANKKNEDPMYCDICNP